MSRPLSKRIAGPVRLLFVVVAVAAAAIGFSDQLPAVFRGLGDIGLARTALATVLVALGLLATAQMWRANLAMLGHRLPTAATHRVFFPAQIGKYLPGAVWPYLAQLRLAGRYGVPGRATLASGAMFLAMHVATGTAFGLLLLVSAGAATERVWWSILLVPPALLLLHPAVLGRLMRALLGRSERAEPPAFGWRDIAVPVGWTLCGWVGYGLAACTLLTAFVPAGDLLVAAVTGTGGFAVAWVIGLVTIIAPAGVGAREAILVLLLAPLVGAVPAAAVALLLRLCHLVADVALALWFGVASSKRNDKSVLDHNPGGK